MTKYTLIAGELGDDYEVALNADCFHDAYDTPIEAFEVARQYAWAYLLSPDENGTVRVVAQFKIKTIYTDATHRMVYHGWQMQNGDFVGGYIESQHYKERNANRDAQGIKPNSEITGINLPGKWINDPL